MSDVNALSFDFGIDIWGRIQPVQSVSGGTIKQVYSHYDTNNPEGGVFSWPVRKYVEYSPIKITVFLGEDWTSWNEWFLNIKESGVLISDETKSSNTQNISIYFYVANTLRQKWMFRWDLINAYPISIEYANMDISSEAKPMLMTIEIGFMDIIMTQNQKPVIL